MSFVIEAAGLQRKIPEADLSPEPPKHSLVVATDVEGPLLLGDTTLHVVTEHVPNGELIYEETYHWFERNFDDRGHGQEGSDIVLVLPYLLRLGVTDALVVQHSLRSQITPGAREYLSFLKSQGALVVGLTTAWDQPHRNIILKDLGLAGIEGTEFSIDEAREQLINSGKWKEEMKLVDAFLLECSNIVSTAGSSGKEEMRHLLRKRIGTFFQTELGVSWDTKGRMTTPGNKTELAKIMAQMDVIGHRRKAEAAKFIFANYGEEGSINIAVGDGYNDRDMLRIAPWSIGINGAKAAEAAKIGVVTGSVSNLIEIFRLIQARPAPTPGNIARVVSVAQASLQGNAIVHVGGSNLSQEIIDAHKAMKVRLREAGSLLP